MKKLLIILMTLSILVLSACASADTDADTQESGTSVSTVSDNNTTVATAGEETKDAAKTTAPSTHTPDEIYNAFLSKLCDKLSNIIIDDTHLDGFADQKGMLGISEYAISGDVQMLTKLGYVICDINNDDTAELIIFQVDHPGTEPSVGSRILSAYTVSKDDMKLIFDGNSKNRYYLLDNGTIYNECSESAYRLGFGLYQLPADGTALVCDEFNFIDYLDTQTANCYRNQSGLFDIDKSELVNGGRETYDTKQREYVTRIQTIEIITFAAYTEKTATE